MTPSNTDIIIGKNLRRLRNNRGWSIEYVAEQMDISAAAVSQYELGQRKVSSEMIVRATKLLGCSIMEIYRGTDPDRPEDMVSDRELNVLSPDVSRVAHWLATEWDGDTDALMIFMGMLAAFPADERREIYMIGDITKDRLLASGKITADQLPPGMDYMLQQLGNLYGDDL